MHTDYQKKKKIVNLLLLLLIVLFIFLTETFTSFNIEADADTILIIDEFTIPILTYHKFCTGDSQDVYTIHITRFEQQMAYLKNNGYLVISIAQLLQCIENNIFPEKPVIITIDDGFKSVYSLAFPVLKEYGFPATLFLYTDFIGNGPNQLSWQEIREMIDAGMEIGSHTLSHSNLLNMKKKESHMDYLKRINQEILLSREILERNTGSLVQSFAYPYGVYSQEIKMLAKQAGYQALLNVNSMNNSIPIDKYSLNRQIIPASCSIKQFENILKEKTLMVNDIFPADGTVTNNQEIKIGVVLNDPLVQQNLLYFRLSGFGLHDYTYSHELQEISFTPVAPKLLQKRTWIAQIAARDIETGEQRKVSWLFTIR